MESSIDNVSQFFAHITEKLSSLGVDGDSSEEREGTLRMHTSLPTWQVLLIIQVILFYVSSIAEARTWTDVTGRTLEAEFLDFKNGNVMIKRLSDGRIFELPFSKFSQEDQSFVRSSMEKAAEPRMQIGDAGMRFDDSKMDPNYPQMQAWKEAGATQ